MSNTPLDWTMEDKMWNFKTKEPKIKKDYFDLYIVSWNNGKKSYRSLYNHNSGKSCIAVYLRFYQWFYQKSSPLFTISHTSGVDIILRKDITSITMRKGVVEVETDGK